MMTEADAINRLLLAEASRGTRLFRNNVGALPGRDGRLIRFGLANDSARVNAIYKSADLIGIRPTLVTPAHVGHIIGVFVSREVKRPGWKYTGRGREVAQKNWMDLINQLGGDADFSTGECA